MTNTSRLFKKGETVCDRKVADWGKRVGSGDAGFCLPAFQRATAWDERRVARLWNSLQRSFPIGTLLFVKGQPDLPGQPDLVARPMPSSPTDGTTRTGEADAELLLLDGQQRLLAIGAAFTLWRESMASRLWIDLVPVESDQEGPLRFHLCSRAHPWGRGASLPDRRAARKAAGIGPFDDQEVSLDQTWPVDAEAPVPAGEILGRLEADVPLKLEHDRVAALLPGFVPEHRERVVASLTPEVLASAEEWLNRALAVRLVALLAPALTNPQAMGEAFARLNRQGVQMSQADLFFSQLKVRWPKANDLVDEIHRDLKAGNVLSPTNVVHAATRIVVADNPDRVKSTAADRLTLESFDELQATSSEGPFDFVKELEKLLTKDGEKQGRLHRAIRKARSLIAYDESRGEDDPGLPTTLLARLEPRAWHALIGWTARHDLEAEEVTEAQRREAIRYALLEHFFVPGRSRWIARDCFERARCASGDTFPAKTIFERLREHGCLEPEPRAPAAVESWLRGDEDEGKARWGLLENERDLLHWSQRRWLTRWFPKHDPTLYRRVDDLPFDVDHIVPQDWLSRQGRGRAETTDLFVRDGRAVLQSVGNLRVWPREANRRDGKKSPLAKLFLGAPPERGLQGEEALTEPPCKFISVGDVRAASLIDESMREAWEMASGRGGNPKDWSSEERFLAFRKAVDQRRLQMYKALYAACGFDEWQSVESAEATKS